MHKDSPAESKKNCIALLCDENYLFPTMVCASQVKTHAPPGTDIYIFLETNKPLDEEKRAFVETACGVQVREIPQWLKDLLDSRVPEGFFQTHVTRAALYRLFVGRLVGDQYARIVYMDGDLQIRRPLAGLFDIDLPAGNVAAAPDWQAMHSVAGMPFGDAARSYLTGLGLSPDQWGSYFNSGVMMASPDTWNQVGSDALDFLVADPKACRWHDQSALNHACKDRLTNISTRWNYLRHFITLQAYDAVDPAIVHFVGTLKPWDGAYAPWGRSGFQPYVDMAKAVRGRDINWPRKPLQRRIAYHLYSFVRPNPYADLAYKAAVDKAVREQAAL